MNNEAQNSKFKVGIYGITGCMGCQLNILYQEELFEILDKINLVSFPAAKGKNINEKLDIAFIEGVVVSKKDRKALKKIRKNSKIIVAMGACATDGCVPAIKHFINNKNIELSVYNEAEIEEIKNLKPMPIDKFVKVDYYIYGCPMDKKEFASFMKHLLLKLDYKQAQKPICFECNMRERGCLLEEGIECLGPVTLGNCSVMCPQDNYPCVGCRGPYKHSNFEAYFKLLQDKNIKIEAIYSHLNRFAGVKYHKMIKKEFKKKGVQF